MPRHTGIHHEIKKRILLTRVIINIIFACFGAYYIVLSLRFPPEHILHLSGDIAFFFSVSLVVDYLMFDIITRQVKHYDLTGENATPAYLEALRFPARYLRLSVANYGFALLFIIVYMSIVISISWWQKINLFIGGLVVMVPMLVITSLSRTKLSEIGYEIWHNSLF